MIYTVSLGRAGVTYTKVLLGIGFFLVLSGCAGASFTVGPVDLDASKEASDSSTEDASDVELSDSTSDVDGNVSDSGTRDNDGGAFEDSPSICEPYSCKPGCAACEAGTSCGHGGSFMCGSPNCAFTGNLDSGGYNCPSDFLVFKCAHYPAANTKDIMPRCLNRGGSTADDEFRYWCCPLNA